MCSTSANFDFGQLAEVEKSFFKSKIDVDPIHRVLMFFHFFLLVQCFQVNVIRISVFFVQTIHRRKEYRLSFAQR